MHFTLHDFVGLLLKATTCAVLAGLAIAFTVGMPSLAQADAPLLIKGKETLYQRVLSRPGGVLHQSPAIDSAIAGAELPSFSMLYVYARQDMGGQVWLKVGRGVNGKADGWIPASKAIDWKQTLTLAFTNPANRGAALFFNDDAYLETLLEDEMLSTKAKDLRAAVKIGNFPETSPVVSVEPDTYVDIQDNFYLLPILEAREAFSGDGFETLLLNVAAVTAQEAEASVKKSAPAPAVPATVKEYRAGIVFVIDATSSMGPYIDRTREAVKKMYETLRSSPNGDKMSFGLVAYRDDISNRPGLEYVAKVFADLEDGQSPDVFLGKVSEVVPATVSSAGFIEDAYAGVERAVKNINWDGYSGRYVVLITDAGARPGKDVRSSTKKNADQIGMMARENGISIRALHLMTDAGKSNHSSAAEQYDRLTHWPNVGSFRYPVEAGSVEMFGKAIDQFIQDLKDSVDVAASGKLIGGEDGAAAAETVAAETKASDARDSELESFRMRAKLVDRAMQLAYLGNKEGTEAPSFFTAWTAERDFVDQSVKAFEVRVLLTKNQLSDLQETLKAILAAGEASRISPEDFFTQMKSAAAAMSRNPDAVSSGQTRKLSDLGLMGEYLEGLPYRSKIMNVTEEDWLSWDFGRQREFLDEIEAKIQLYTDFHDDTNLWVAFDGGKTPGEAMYPTPLEALP